MTPAWRPIILILRERAKATSARRADPAAGRRAPNAVIALARSVSIVRRCEGLRESCQKPRVGHLVPDSSGAVALHRETKRRTPQLGGALARTKEGALSGRGARECLGLSRPLPTDLLAAASRQRAGHLSPPADLGDNTCARRARSSFSEQCVVRPELVGNSFRIKWLG